MTGHVTKHRDAWVWRIEVGKDEQGKRVRRRSPRTFKLKLKKEAQQDLARTLHEMDSGLWVEPNKQTFGEFLQEWSESIRATIRPSTLASYRQKLRLHVVPALGNVPLSKLQPSHLSGLYADLAEKPLSPRTIAYVHAIIHRALKDAVRWGKAARNVADLVDPPKQNAPKMNVWTRSQVRGFLEGVRGHRLYPVYLLAVTTGMRRGELLGLRWSDVDLDKGKLTVAQTLIEIEYGVEFSVPKTDRSRRTIRIDQETVAVLKAHRKLQTEERLLWGPAWQDAGLVFTRPDGTHTHPQAASQTFEKQVTRLGLPKLSFHGLRHTYATLALEAGMKPWDLSDRLGHSSVAFTLQVYRHAVQATQDSAADAAAAFILGTNA